MIMRLIHRPTSLRARLALWYMLVIGITLACFGLIVYTAGIAYVGNARDTTLRERAALVSDRVYQGGRALRFGGTTAFPIGEGTAAYLFDGRGRLVDQVLGPSAVPPWAGVRGVLASGRAGFATWGNIRLYMLAVRDNRGRIVGGVQVAQSVDKVIAGVGPLGVWALLFLSIPLLLIIGAGAGLFLAGRALAPIDRITHTAQAIGAGNLQGRLGMGRRDDEVGRLAATFDGMLDRLERAFAQQRQFVADASHELRTPLTIIKGDLEVLLRRPRSPAEYEEVARGVADEVARLSRLAEDLLTLARADSGQAEITHEFLYLDALVETVIAGACRLARTKGVAIETSLKRDVAILGDSGRLHQLLLNLLGNAVKYTPAGGRVQVGLTTQDSTARLEVADTGPGIAPEDLPHVFDRFYRADKARSHAEGGAGLGLAIARWCAEAHGGRIVGQSDLGAGSRFTVSLPLAPLDDSEDERPCHAVETVRSPRREAGAHER